MPRTLNNDRLRGILLNRDHRRGIAQWLARLLWEQKVAGSTPAAPTSFKLKKITAKIYNHVQVFLFPQRGYCFFALFAAKGSGDFFRGCRAASNAARRFVASLLVAPRCPDQFETQKITAKIYNHVQQGNDTR